MTKTIATFSNTEFFKELEKRVTKLEERVLLDDPSKTKRETPQQKDEIQMTRFLEHPCDSCKFNTPELNIGCKYRPHCYDWKRWRLGGYNNIHSYQFFCCHCGQLMHERSISPQVKLRCFSCGAEC